jgi:hypothetical protein
VRGPSLKGALRQAAQEAALNSKELLWLFGPETSNASAFGGALSVGDARLLLRELIDSKLDSVFPLGAIPTPNRENSDLTGIRDKAALDRLSAEECAACEKLWADVAALLKKTETSTKKGDK